MKGVFLILFLHLFIDICSAVPWSEATDLRGQYCETRTKNKCCSDRRDECSVPIRDTLCYCDEFCNRTTNDDCCPDYWTFCMGLPIPAPLEERQCYHHGQTYNYGETPKINCNQCKCQDVNGVMELMCETNKCLVDEDLLEEVNRNFRALGWRASNYSTFWGRRYDEGISSRLGTIHSRKKVLQMIPINPIFDRQSIPRIFDSRIKWPGIISTPRDQGWCGSSWVLSTVAVASDRFAIMTYGNDQTFLSPQHLLDCSRNQRGCQGGHLTKAWTFIRKYGLVPDTCYPWQERQSECKIQRLRTPLSATCPADPLMPTKGDLHRVGPVYRVSGESKIMHEIMTSGPMQATMRVSREFFSYKSGIFRCTNITDNDRSAYHSVRIIGWGEDYQYNQLVKYWIVANSWGEWWGEDGYFRILRGVNECSIEEFVIAAWANVEDLKTASNTIRQSRNVQLQSYKH